MMAADGANPRPVMDVSQEATAAVGFFAWLPTGRSLIYRSSKDSQLYTYDFDSKATRRLTNEPRLMPVISVSSDGKWIVYQTTMRGNVDVRAIPIEGGEARFVVSTPHQDYHPFLSPSGKWLYFQYDHKNLYRVPGPAQNWITKEPEKITNFPESGLFLEDPQISNDGKQLLYSRAKITGDVWILSLQK
jgi:Tol biopolymer transport system component